MSGIGLPTLSVTGNRDLNTVANFGGVAAIAGGITGLIKSRGSAVSTAGNIGSYGVRYGVVAAALAGEAIYLQKHAAGNTSVVQGGIVGAAMGAATVLGTYVGLSGKLPAVHTGTLAGVGALIGITAGISMALSAQTAASRR